MFALITEAAMAGWVGTIAVKGVAKYRQQIWRGIKWVGLKIPGAKLITTVGKFIGGRVKNVAVKIGGTISPRISKKVSEFLAKMGFSFGKKFAGSFGKGAITASTPKLAGALGRASGTMSTAFYLENFVFCPPGAWPCGKVIAYALVIGSWALDHVWTTLPLIMMVRWGHDASDKELNNVKCYSITADKFYAEPANCKTKRDNLKVSELAGDYSTYLPGVVEVPLIPTCEFDKPASSNEQGGIESKSDFCYSCPNYFVSQPDAEITTLKLTLPGTEGLGEGINIYPATAILVGPKIVCSTWAIGSAWKGAACTVGYWLGLISLFYANPAWVINFFARTRLLVRRQFLE